MVGLLIQPSFSKGEVTPELGGRVDLATYKTALATARNMIVRPYGGICNRAGTKWLGFNTNRTRISILRRFRFNTTSTYVLEFCYQSMRVIKNDAFVLETAKAITGINKANPCVVTIPAHGFNLGDSLKFDGNVGGMTRLLNRWLNVGTIIDANNFVITDPVTALPIDSSAFPSWTGGGTVSRVYTIATPWIDTDLTSLSFVQSGDVMTITHPSYDEVSLTRTGDAAWTITTDTFTPVQLAPTGVTVTPAVPAGASFSYAVTSLSSITGEESLPVVASTATSNTTRANTIAWSAAANTSLYSVYLNQNGIYGLIGTTPNLSFLDANYAPSLSITPPSARNPFAGAGNRPATAMYFQQRLVRGGSTNAPDTVEASQIGNFNNLAIGTPSTDSDAIEFTLTSKEVNVIRHFVPVKQDLLVFTAGSEWRVTSNGQAFTAANLQILPQSAWGSSLLEPQLIGLTVLFTTENGMTIRSARYTYVQDAYQGEDVTLLSSHLFTPSTQIQSWASGKIPDPVVVCALGGGGAACLTYQEEQQVTGWTRWDTANGLFEQVEIVRPQLAAGVVDDAVYFVVRRNINGQSVRMIERLATRRFADLRDNYFVDCGLTYDRPVTITSVSLANPVVVTAPGHLFNNQSTVDIFDINWVQVLDATGNPIGVNQLNGGRYAINVLDVNSFQLVGIDGTGFVNYANNGTARSVVSQVSGLDHIEGETVSALIDGNAYLGLTVSQGTVVLPILGSRVHIGKQIIADTETLDLEAPQGSIQGKVKRMPFVTVRVVNSRGWLCGERASDLVETKMRQYELIGDPIALLTGDLPVTTGSDWNSNGRCFVRQMYPLPLEILDIIPGLEVED